MEAIPLDAINILARCNVVCCANYIKENLGCISIKQDDRLMEMNFGDWEMKIGMLLILMKQSLDG
jgi:broad specificity phosphatase PhoE